MDNADVIVAGWGVTQMGGAMVKLGAFYTLNIQMLTVCKKKITHHPSPFGLKVIKHTGIITGIYP